MVQHLIRRTHKLIYILIALNLIFLISIFALHSIQISNLQSQFGSSRTELKGQLDALSEETGGKFAVLDEDLEQLNQLMVDTGLSLNNINAHLIALGDELDVVREEGAKGLEALKSELNYTGIIQEAMEAVVIAEKSDRVIGAGVLISPFGHIATAAHVVEDRTNLKIRLMDGRTFVPEIEKRDKDRDIAIIRIGVFNNSYLDFAPVDQLNVGDKVFALGSPEGLEFSASEGIVSGIREFEELGVGNGFDDDLLLIQTDAAITRGNSGGPLIDKKGQIVGINSFSLGYSIRGSSLFLDTEGVNFAIASDEARDIYASI